MDKAIIYSSKNELLKFLGIKENFLYSDFSKKYHTQERPKKNGGVRIIKPPNPNLKKVQRLILDKILYQYPQLPCVYGLSKEKGIFYNAKAHHYNHSEHLLILDIENFFPSISQIKIKNLFQKLGFNKENSALLTKLCTVEESLPQGAPTSPYLASMICAKLDKDLFIYCKRRGLIYTRYFDDISISGKGISNQLIQELEKLVAKHGFKCKEEKKDLFKPGIDKIINSVVIRANGFSVTQKYKTEILEKYQIMVANDSLSNRRVFNGKFGFYLHINKEEALAYLEKIKLH